MFVIVIIDNGKRDQPLIKRVIGKYLSIYDAKVYLESVGVTQETEILHTKGNLRYWIVPLTEQQWANYADSKCQYGYMTICDKCVSDGSNVPHHVDLNKIVPSTLPHPRCELCKKKLDY